MSHECMMESGFEIFLVPPCPTTGVESKRNKPDNENQNNRTLKLYELWYLQQTEDDKNKMNFNEKRFAKT